MDSRQRVYETVVRGDVAGFVALIEAGSNNNDEEQEMMEVMIRKQLLLHLAARMGHVELVKEMVKRHPIGVSALNEKKETPLHEACREGWVEVARFLVEMDPWVVCKLNEEKESALLVATKRGKSEVVSYLLENSQWILLMMEVDAPTTSLHAAASGGHTEIVKEILKVRPDFAWKREMSQGCTPLHQACTKGHLNVARELLKLDADLASVQDNDGRTPLHYAAMKGRVNIIDEILCYSLDSAHTITARGETVLHMSVKNNQFEAVKYLIEKLNTTMLLNIPDHHGNTILHLATAGKLSTMVIYLLKVGIEVNAINQKGQTALDVVESDSSSSGPLLILPALLDAGAKKCSQLPPTSSGEILHHQEIKLLSKSPRQHQHDQHHHRSRGSRRRREKQLEIQNEGLRNARNTIAVVAVLIATVTFAAGVNPPGGLNQQSGKAILGRQGSFKVFMVCNILALFLSLGVVILLVSIIPFRRKPMMTLLALAHKVMWVSALLMAAAYLAAVWTVLPHREAAWVVGIGGGSTALIFVGLSVLLVKHWMRKREYYWMRRQNNNNNNNDEMTKKKRGNHNNHNVMSCSPNGSGVSGLEELKAMKKGGRYSSSSNSDVGSSEKEGYHLY
ncbi:Ankyrin repeat-containing protein At5g02620 [Linum grandiflorum]